MGCHRITNYMKNVLDIILLQFLALELIYELISARYSIKYHILGKFERLGPQGPCMAPRRGLYLAKTTTRLDLLRSFQFFKRAALLLNSLGNECLVLLRAHLHMAWRSSCLPTKSRRRFFLRRASQACSIMQYSEKLVQLPEENVANFYFSACRLQIFCYLLALFCKSMADVTCEPKKGKLLAEKKNLKEVFGALKIL